MTAGLRVMRFHGNIHAKKSSTRKSLLPSNRPDARRSFSRTGRIRIWTVVGFLIGIIGMTALLASCAKVEKPPAVSYVESTALPSTLAVMPVTFLPITEKTTGDFPVEAESEKGKFIGELARGVIHNQLAGKGYVMRLLTIVDETLGNSAPADVAPGDLCDKLEVNGLIYPEIVTATMVTGVAYDLFKIEARIRLVDKNGKELGTWQDVASKRKISVPTSPVGVATTIAGALLNESARKQMRLVIYDWGWKACQFVPDNPLGKSLPEVISVDSNIDKGVFAAGDQLTVETIAEKNLTCTFDLGKFKKQLPMSDTGGGTYKGVYTIQQGDQAIHQPLSIHLKRPNGIERVWMETGGTVTIDGVPPPSPGDIDGQASRNGISLTWALPQGEDLKNFSVEKSEKAVGDFATVGSTKDLSYLDADVSQGHTYYYRVRAVDSAGNRSANQKTVKVTVPLYDEVTLTGSLSGTLVSGVYRMEGECFVTEGDVLEIGAGSKVTLDPEARIRIDGVLKTNGSSRHAALFEGTGWKGIVVGERGQVELTFTDLRGCTACLETAGGGITLRSVSIEGDQGDGITVSENGVLAMKGGEISGCQRAIVIEGGRGSIEESTLTGNDIGLDVDSGSIGLTGNNLFDNRQTDLRTHRKLVIEGNYLGGTDTKALKLEGDILVKSLLDAPFPHGRTLVLLEDKEFTPEVIDKTFDEHKSKGIAAFGERHFGDAYEELTKALKLKEDKEVYLYLAYTQSSLGEEDKMAETLEQGIRTFPYEVKLYQIYIKYLAAQGQNEKASALLDKALKMNPEDQSLAFMKQYIDSMEE